MSGGLLTPRQIHFGKCPQQDLRTGVGPRCIGREDLTEPARAGAAMEQANHMARDMAESSTRCNVPPGVARHGSYDCRKIRLGFIIAKELRIHLG